MLLYITLHMGIQGTDRPFPRLGQDIRLDNRWLDLRTPANGAIMRLQAGVCQLFRSGLA